MEKSKKKSLKKCQKRPKENILIGLVSSRLRIKILDLLISHEDKEFYYREIVEKIGVAQRGTIARELKNLEGFGYIIRRVSDRRKLYRINVDNPIYLDLRSILMKTVGVFSQLKTCLEPLKDRIDFAFVYGSFASASEGVKSDIDLMIVGKVKGREISERLSDRSLKLGREINYSVFLLEEVERRLSESDHFWTSVFRGEKFFLMGRPDEFRRLGEKRVDKAPSNLEG